MADTRYLPVGYCIYCGRAGVDLSDEHIIPYGLNGDHVLPAASCEKCAAVTSLIEREMLKGEMAQVRAALSFKTRRPKDVPKSFPLLVTRGGKEERVDAPIADHLVLLPLPIYPAPAFINPYDYSGGIKLDKVQVLRFGQDPEELLKTYGAEKVGMEFRIDHRIFARLLAKIAYAFALAHLKGRRFRTVYVLPIIMGDVSDAGKWIGSSEAVLDPEPPGVQHSMQMKTFRQQPEQGGAEIAIVLMKLFADVPCPGYVVIVGELEEMACVGA